MDVIHFDVRCSSRGEDINIIPLGDIHTGVVFCDEEKLDRLIAWGIERPHTYFMLMGDMAEYINYNDKRFDPTVLQEYCRYRLDDLAEAQMMWIYEKLQPLAKRGKIMGGITGNHEETIRTKYQRDIHATLCTLLKIPCMGYSGFIRFRMYRSSVACQQLIIYAHHGFGSAKTTGAKINKVVELQNSFEADIYMMAHLHDKVCTTKPRIVCSSGADTFSHADRAFGINGGFFRTYLQGFKSYGEMRGYPPGKMGVIKYMISPFRQYKQKGVARDLPPDIHVSE